MNNLARRRIRLLPPKVRTVLPKRRNTKKNPLSECPRGVLDEKVANWLSKFHSSPRDKELFCRYLLARAVLRRRYKVQIVLKEHHLYPKPPVMVRLEFRTKDNEINQDLNDLVERAGFKLALKKEPINGKIHKAYVITEDEKSHSSDITKITETMEKLLSLASRWEAQSREAAERKAVNKDGMWAAWMTVRCGSAI